MESSSSSGSSNNDSSDVEPLDPSYFANANQSIKNEQIPKPSLQNRKNSQKLSSSSSSPSSLIIKNNKNPSKEHDAQQQKIPQVNLDAVGMSESDKDIDNLQKQSYVLKLSMLPAQPIPARKLDSPNDDPIFAKNKSNQNYSIEFKANKNIKQESELVNIEEGKSKGKGEEKLWNVKNAETEDKKKNREIRVEEIKILEEISGVKDHETAQKKKDNVKLFAAKAKEQQEEEKANVGTTEPLKSSEIVKNLNIQPKIPKKKSPKERDSVSSIDSRPSVRGKKQDFKFDFPKDSEISNQDKPKSSTNPNKNQKATLSQKYKNLDSSISSSSSSSDEDSQKEIKVLVKKPEKSQLNLEIKSNSPLFKLNAEKKKESPKIEVSIKNEPEPETIDKKIPELPSAVQVARKLKNNPSDLQNQEVKPIDPQLEPPVERFHKEIGLSIPKNREEESVNADTEEIKCYTFDDALSIFKNLKLPKSSSRVMIKPSFFARLCGCCGKSNVKLTKEQAEDCDKIISFSETIFRMSQAFHKSLLLSVYCSITNETSWPHSFKKIGISNFDKETKLRGIPQFLIFMLFLTNFFTKSTKEMLEASKDKEKGFPFAPCLLKLGEIAIKVLKANKLNKFIKSNNKTFEVIFFFYIGIVHYWYKNFTQNNSNMSQFDMIYNKTLKKAMGGPNDLILSARSTFAKQSKNI
ncbi:unnamed protein product [Blepharisma stoltei]|uniref:Uncharacterized protein n=1 Tax=Blepharisma stoltei TaxID=1481888 RepID=A0AAU9JFY5_9CILI|nr:unnamed protein product [Blepharisma stoltei]